MREGGQGREDQLQVGEEGWGQRAACGQSPPMHVLVPGLAGRTLRGSAMPALRALCPVSLEEPEQGNRLVAEGARALCCLRPLAPEGQRCLCLPAGHTEHRALSRRVRGQDPRGHLHLPAELPHRGIHTWNPFSSSRSSWGAGELPLGQEPPRSGHPMRGWPRPHALSTPVRGAAPSRVPKAPTGGGRTPVLRDAVGSDLQGTRAVTCGRRGHLWGEPTLSARSSPRSHGQSWRRCRWCPLPRAQNVGSVGCVFYDVAWMSHM